MFNFKLYNKRNFNYFLVLFVCILCVISTYSIKMSGGASFQRQLMGLIMGVVIMAVVSMMDYHTICQFSVFYYIIITIMLLLTRFGPLRTDYGTGTYRWIDLGPLPIQTSEFAKITLVIILAVLFVRMEDYMDRWMTLFLTGIIAAVPTLLVLIQTDLSSSVVMMFVFTIMIFAAGLSYKIVLTIIGTVIPTGAVLFWYILQPNNMLLKPYQQKRILGFLDQEKYGSDTMWQQNNSVQAIASGKLYGKLLGGGTSGTRNYNSVAVNESDFIWSVVGEEFGFIGGCIVIALQVCIIVICLRTARRAKDKLGQLIAIGISAMFIFQLFANIGVATCILPNTGLPLPFISYGLSSLMSSMIAIGIILNISLQQKNSLRG